MVRGLGESIVSGLVPGSALGCLVKKTDLENPEVQCVSCLHQLASSIVSTKKICPNARACSLV